MFEAISEQAGAGKSLFGSKASAISLEDYILACVLHGAGDFSTYERLLYNTAANNPCIETVLSSKGLITPDGKIIRDIAAFIGHLSSYEVEEFVYAAHILQNRDIHVEGEEVVASFLEDNRDLQLGKSDGTFPKFFLTPKFSMILARDIETGVVILRPHLRYNKHLWMNLAYDYCPFIVAEGTNSYVASSYRYPVLDDRSSDTRLVVSYRAKVGDRIASLMHSFLRRNLGFVIKENITLQKLIQNPAYLSALKDALYKTVPKDWDEGSGKPNELVSYEIIDELSQLLAHYELLSRDTAFNAELRGQSVLQLGPHGSMRSWPRDPATWIMSVKGLSIYDSLTGLRDAEFKNTAYQKNGIAVRLLSMFRKNTLAHGILLYASAVDENLANPTVMAPSLSGDFSMGVSGGKWMFTTSFTSRITWREFRYPLTIYLKKGEKKYLLCTGCGSHKWDLLHLTHEIGSWRGWINDDTGRTLKVFDLSDNDFAIAGKVAELKSEKIAEVLSALDDGESSVKLGASNF